jgi:hypothetical protein
MKLSYSLCPVVQRRMIVVTGLVILIWPAAYLAGRTQDLDWLPYALIWLLYASSVLLRESVTLDVTSAQVRIACSIACAPLGDSKIYHFNEFTHVVVILGDWSKKWDICLCGPNRTITLRIERCHEVVLSDAVQLSRLLGVECRTLIRDRYLVVGEIEGPDIDPCAVDEPAASREES